MTDHPDDDRAPDGHETGGRDEAAAISIRLDALLGERQLTLTELSDRVGVTVVNLSVLKNGRARAIRFSTLAALCRALDCQPGDLLRYQSDEPAESRRPPLDGIAGR
jgi:putative transcriptional regulator